MPEKAPVVMAQTSTTNTSEKSSKVGLINANASLNGSNGNGNGSSNNNNNSNTTQPPSNVIPISSNSNHRFSLLLSSAIAEPVPKPHVPNNRLTFSVSSSESHYPPHLRELMSVFRTYYHMPDCSTILVSLAAMVAHYMKGPPVWVMLIGAPGSGKTAAIESAGCLPDVAFLASITSVAGLLSGTSKKDVVAGATGGVLAGKKEIILLLKEFNSILSLQRDKRTEIIGAFREIADGRWSRDIGGDGGRSLSWEGKVSMLAGCTQTIDSFNQVIGAMGERFVFYRLPPTNPGAQASMVAKRWSAGGTNDARVIQNATAEAVFNLFGEIDYSPNKSPIVSDEEQNRLVGMALVSCRCRSVVERNPYQHNEITLVSEPESPGRLVGVLTQLYCAMKVMGIPANDAWAIMGKMALDCMASIRRQVMNVLTTNYKVWLDGDMISACIEGYSKTTIRRVLEDLSILCVATRGKVDNRDVWQLSELAASDFKQAFPKEMDE